MASIASTSHTPIHTAIPDLQPAANKPKLTHTTSLPANIDPAAPKALTRSNSSSANMLAARALGDDLGKMDDIPFKSLKMAKADLREMAKEVKKLPMPPSPAAADHASNSAPLAAKTIQEHVQQNAGVTKKRMQQAALVRKELETAGQSMRSLASIAEGSVLESELDGAFAASERFFSTHQGADLTARLQVDLDDSVSEDFLDALSELPPEEDDASVLIRQDTRRSDAPSTPPRESGHITLDITADVAATATAPADDARRVEVKKLMDQIPTWRANLVSGSTTVNVITNSIISAVRDGTITAVATYARELVGHAINNTDMSDETAENITYAILGATAVLNLATMVMQRKGKVDNLTTRICNGINVAAAAGIAIALGKTSTAGNNSAGHANTTALMAKAGAYVFVRDTLNYVFPMGDSMDPGPSAPLTAGFIGEGQYAAAQVGANYAQGRPGVFSGTSGTAGELGLTDPALHAGVAQFAGINGAAEAFDGVNFSYATAAAQGRIPVDIDGVQRGGKSDVVLTPSIRPFFKPQAEGEPPQTFGGAAMDHAKGYMEKVLGTMTKRASALTTAYGALGLMNKFVPQADLSEDEVNAIFNVGLGAGAALVTYPLFVGSLAESAKPVEPEQERPRDENV